MGAEFTLVRVVRPVTAARIRPGGRRRWPAHPGLEQLEAEQKQQLRAGGELPGDDGGPLRARSLTVRTRVVVEEQPAVGILQEAQKADADLIALATHGRRGLSRLFLGSVADKVVRGGRLPVLLRAAEGSERPVARRSE